MTKRANPRVVLLIRSLNVGGAERQAALTACELARMGVDVSVVVFYPRGRFEQSVRDAGVTVHLLGKSGRWDVVRSGHRLFTTLQSLSPDVIYSYGDTPNFAASAMRVVLPHVRLIWGIRASNTDYRVYGPLHRMLSHTAKYAALAAHRIIVNSDRGRAHLLHLGYPDRKIAVVPNGIDTRTFAPNSEAASALRRRLGVADNAPLIGMAARLDPVKDHECFLQAAALMHGERPEVRFLCVGDGPASLLDHLRERTRQLGLGDSVIWDGPHEDMAAVYSALTLLTSTSAFGEGFSNVIGEAMACGTPVVATDVGDSARIVGHTGTIVQPRDPRALKRAWTDTLDGDPRQRGQDARTRVEACFSVDTLAARTHDVIVETLAG